MIKFYLSKASERLLKETNSSQEKVDELLEIALKLSLAFLRETPTISDVQVAIAIGSLENCKKIAEGLIPLDFSYPHAKETLSKPQRILFWKNVCQSFMETKIS